jgi:Domain of unknown function (DUF397)
MSRNFDWRRTSACVQDNCVEVAWHGDAVHVRDSKDPSGTCLHFTPAEWVGFLLGVALGEFSIGTLRAAEDVAGHYRKPHAS